MKSEFGGLRKKAPGPMIDLIDHYTESAADCAKVLEGLDTYLGEYEERCFPCTCEDGDVPLGSMEWDTGAYNHHPDCPQGTYYHYHVFLAGVARFLREMQQVGPSPLHIATVTAQRQEEDGLWRIAMSPMVVHPELGESAENLAMIVAAREVFPEKDGWRDHCAYTAPLGVPVLATIMADRDAVPGEIRVVRLKENGQ